jgi:hypothetical protein
MMLMTSLGASAQPLTGRWDGTAKVAEGLTVPVHLELFRTDGQLKELSKMERKRQSQPKAKIAATL